MKRVVAFFDMFDGIPDNAKYLFSRKIEKPESDTEETKVGKIVSTNPELTDESAIIFIHYYEVDEMDFEGLMDSNFAKKTNTEKMKELFHKYKIPVK
jgi:hypothetical protein